MINCMYPLTCWGPNIRHPMAIPAPHSSAPSPAHPHHIVKQILDMTRQLGLLSYITVKDDSKSNKGAWVV